MTRVRRRTKRRMRSRMRMRLTRMVDGKGGAEPVCRGEKWSASRPCASSSSW